MLLLGAVQRRAVLSAALAAALSSRPRAAEADMFSLSALPVNSRLREQLEASLRPPVRALPRRNMPLEFAVLLMRTSYQVADDMDFMAMNDFQKQFFVLRQAEWEGYKKELPNLMQGDLSDPAYFDFISFAQYATLTAGMRSAPQVFEELIDANGTSVVVTRPLDLADNTLLPQVYAERVGTALLSKLCEKYAAIAPRAPSPSETLTSARILEEVKNIAGERCGI
jgi:hypothetical protein